MDRGPIFSPLLKGTFSPSIALNIVPLQAYDLGGLLV